MKTMNLDEFADYKVTAIEPMGGLLFSHTICGHSELLELQDAPLKFLMVKATEHWMECSKDE